MDPAPERIWDFVFLSPRAYVLTMLKDGGEIFYSFGGNSSYSSKRPTRVATLSFPPLSNEGVTLGLILTAMAGPFLAHPPADALFVSEHSVRLYVVSRSSGARWQPVCFVVLSPTIMLHA